ncbi:MAG TPA: S8 family serine peptidase [Solirubrobacterales bacterium]|nr:S8 family serine peptidase [Solirubrobacterales bacterium]
MSNRARLYCLCLLSFGVLAIFSTPASAAEERNPYIVVFEDSVQAPAALAHSQAEEHNGRLGFVYSHAIKGYSAELPPAAVTALEHDPRIKSISPDGPVELLEEEVGLETENNEGPEISEATTPTGINRVFATSNKALDIDGQDDVRANVDVAVIDTGIDSTQPDLNVVGRTNCTLEAKTCVDNSGTDGNSHGTHVAGTIGALDNGFGVVGVAPGARLWSVKVLNDSGGGTWSQVIAGIDWVTAHANEIEVANLSLGGNGTWPEVREAIEGAVKAGVVVVAAAGNSNGDSKNFTPAFVPSAITVSAIADYDGKPGGKAAPTCANYGLDDQRATFSNYGSVIDVTAPGVCILSTEPGNTYGVKSGTSMASPLVAGAAALLAAKNNPNSAENVEEIRNTLRATGNYGWVDTSGDGVKEPLLDVSNESVYSLVSAPTVTTGSVAYVGVGASTETLLTGTIDPKGLSTTYQFEYVEAANYKPEAENPYAEGAKVPLTSASLSGTVDQSYEVQQAVSELKAGTTYHYRLVAENSKGVAKGGDQSFTALSTCKGTEAQCEWSLQTTANPEAEKRAELEDVSCPSSTACLAVGSDRYVSKGFFELWNGSEWKRITSFSGGELKAISCPTATWCMAVAKSEAKAWQLKWTEGFNVWSTEAKTPPTPEGATELKIKDVSCSSESACTAVGRYSLSGTWKPYVARWSGTSWALQTAPSPGEGNASEAMLSVSCGSASFCLAVGKAASKPFAERWNGSEWTTQSAPNPTGATEAVLESVSCPSASSCMAVGYSKASGTKRRTLTESWNGSALAVVTSPNPAKEGDAMLRSVSCPSTGSCIAAGVLAYPTILSEEETTLALSWNGTSWTLQSTPNPSGNLFSSLAGVSCSSSVACSAVGRSRPTSAESNTQTLGERWNGETWSLQTTANPEAEKRAELEDLSCPSSTMCMAVGNDRYLSKGLFEFWNGSEWKLTPKISGGELKAISCPTASWCMAIAKGETKSWLLQWSEGFGSWSASSKTLPTPEGGTEIKLADVSCSSESVCTAVGRYSLSGTWKPYVARWSGTSWALQTAPSPGEGTASEAMLSVSCGSASFCLAVGKAASKPFAERWNGSEWTIQYAPNPSGATSASLEAVSCPSATACMAVGGSNVSPKTLAESWNGTSLSIAASPNPGKEGYPLLRSVSCPSASSCIAAGSFVNSTGSEETTLAFSWNGTSWTLQSTLNPSGNLFSSLAGVSCSSPVACSAVGGSRPTSAVGNTQTLGERWQ